MYEDHYWERRWIVLFCKITTKNPYLNNKLAFLQCITRQCMSCFKVDKGNTILLDKIISRSYNRSVLHSNQDFTLLFPSNGNKFIALHLMWYCLLENKSNQVIKMNNYLSYGSLWRFQKIHVLTQKQLKLSLDEHLHQLKKQYDNFCLCQEL